jgi:hypothetical protein
MKPTGNGSHIRWRVECSQAVAQTLYDIQDEASAQGRGQQALAAFRSIVECLRSDPTEFGEPLYRLPIMRLKVRSASIAPLVVHFAVSEDRPIVFIRAVKLMSP